ncbi:MAG: transposase [Thermoanaerobaculia bacterium]|nr:transposase [Thermoanaerobaculia bacterium]
MYRSNKPLPHPSSPRWISRGYLPHFQEPGAIQHVVFHLADSVPKDVLATMDTKIRGVPANDQSGERRRLREFCLDHGHGCCVLQFPKVATAMQDILRHFEGQRYDLFAWAVMPSHVHALCLPRDDWPLARIVASWKRYSARTIRDLVRAGEASSVGIYDVTPVWHPEYFDRFIRDDDHYWQTVRYIEENPVKARLAKRAEDWPWSSAGKGQRHVFPR